MDITQQGTSVDLDELIDADDYQVDFFAQVKGMRGSKYEVRYKRSHENGPDFRETARDIIERGVRQFSPVTAHFANQNGIILSEFNVTNY